MSSAIVQRRKSVLKRPPSQQVPSDVSPVFIVSATVSTTTLTLTFDQVINVQGLPAYTTDVAGATVLSMTQPAPHQVAIVFSADITAATALNLPFRDPAIRGASGGYVTSNTFPI